MKLSQNPYLEKINNTETALFDQAKIKEVHAENEIEYNDYINLTLADLKRLNKAECAEAQYFIYQYCVHLSAKLAEFRTAQALAKSELDKELSKVWKSYTSEKEFLPKEIITANACNEHQHIDELNNQVISLNQYVSKLFGMLEGLQKMAVTLHSLSFSK